MHTSSAISNVQLIYDCCCGCSCLDTSSIFGYSKRWIKLGATIFVCKPKINSECWLWHMVKILGPQQILSVARNGYSWPRKCERPKACWTPEHIDDVKKLVLTNRRLIVRQVSENINVSIDVCHSIFANVLDMRRVARKFVPKLLNFDQIEHRINTEVLDFVRYNANLLQTFITWEQRPNKCAKFGWMSYIQFSSIAGEWCIISCYHWIG